MSDLLKFMTLQLGFSIHSLTHTHMYVCVCVYTFNLCKITKISTWLEVHRQTACQTFWTPKKSLVTNSLRTGKYGFHACQLCSFFTLHTYMHTYIGIMDYMSWHVQAKVPKAILNIYNFFRFYVFFLVLLLLLLLLSSLPLSSKVYTKTTQHFVERNIFPVFTVSRTTVRTYVSAYAHKFICIWLFNKCLDRWCCMFLLRTVMD